MMTTLKLMFLCVFVCGAISIGNAQQPEEPAVVGEFAEITVPYASRPTQYRITGTDLVQTIRVDDIPGGIEVIETVAGEQRVTQLMGVEYLVVLLRGGDDYIELNSVVPNRVKGDRGNDTILGGPGTDRLYGGRGNDVIDGREGNDSVIGEHDDDELIGGPGRDSIHDIFGDNTIDAEDGEADYVYHNAESEVSVDSVDRVRNVGKTSRRRR